MIPTDGIYRDPKHAYFDHGNGPLTSVTTAIGMYDKSDALVGWAKKVTADFAVRHLDTLMDHRAHNKPEVGCPPCDANLKRRRQDDRTEAARKWVSAISDYQRDTAADLGTDVHAVAEKLANGQDEDIAPELRLYAEQYRRFMAENGPDYRLIEYIGVNREDGYAGTGDIIADIPDFPDDYTVNVETWAIDIKTFTKPGPVPKDYYPTTGMQLAACSRFTHVATRTDDLGDDRVIGREVVPLADIVGSIDRYGVLLIGTEDYRLIPYRVTDRTYRAFLHCLALHAWKHGEGATIVEAA